ncbi:MAG: adenylyl-sulfate kinase [Planctomycetota bacterium]|nr:adenylyl-sulfate kinase [Planctomycetota bacterium]
MKESSSNHPQQSTKSQMTDHKGFVLWFTGLSGSGKSTLSRMIEGELRKRGCKIEVLDGDEVRENLSKGLGFSKEDRDTNIRRIGYVAKLLARNGAIAITAAISPYAEVRNQCRAMNRNFVEVYAECSIEELTRRDVKGLYAKALSGEIKNFTGISDPYEAPENPEVTINSETQSEEESLVAIMSYLESSGYIPAVAANA